MSLYETKKQARAPIDLAKSGLYGNSDDLLGSLLYLWVEELQYMHLRVFLTTGLITARRRDKCSRRFRHHHVDGVCHASELRTKSRFQWFVD